MSYVGNKDFDDDSSQNQDQTPDANATSQDAPAPQSAGPNANADTAPIQSQGSQDDSQAPVETEDSGSSEVQGAPDSQAQPAQPPVDPSNVPVNAAQDYAEKKALGNDISTGKITPKTYHDLYESKSTLGKIGTLFGLMLSGAGSGLTHQPNAVLGMMNDTINRDLDAQKTNAAGKLNWYSAANQHETTMANNALTYANANLAQQNVVGGALSNQNAQWKNAQLGLVPDAATNTAKAGMSLAAVQHLQDINNKLAPGSAKTQGQNIIDNVIRPGIDQQIQQNSSNLAHKRALVNQLYPPQTAPQDPNMRQISYGPPGSQNGASGQQNLVDPIDERALSGAIGKGRVAPQAPDAIVNEEHAQSEAGAARSLALTRQRYYDTVASLKQMKNGGENPFIAGIQGLLPTAGSVLGPVGTAIGALGSAALSPVKSLVQSPRETAIAGLQEAMPGIDVEKLVPGFANSDNPKVLQSAMKNAENYFAKRMQEVAPTLVTKKIIKGFGPAQSSASQASPQSPIPTSGGSQNGDMQAFNNAAKSQGL